MRRILIPSFISLIFISIIAVYLYSCRHETVNLNDYPEIKFNTQVLPIFTNSCAISDCHDAITSSEGYNLTNYEGIINGVVKGKPYSSEIYKSIIDVNEGMPPDMPLNIKSRSIIKLWIEQGANNTIDTTGSIDTTGNNDTITAAGFACYSRDIEPIINSNCAKPGCHISGNQEVFPLTSYNEVKNHVISGQPGKSELYKVITNTDEDLMPPSPEKPLNKADIDSIFSWIITGAEYKTCKVICDTNKYTFSGQVFPIISSNCKGCHSGANPSKGIILQDYASISMAAKNGQLLGVITGSNKYVQMPPNTRLSDCNITLIKKWVANGNKNDK